MEFQVGETRSGYEFLDVLKRSKNGIEFRVKNTLAGRVVRGSIVGEFRSPIVPSAGSRAWLAGFF